MKNSNTYKIAAMAVLLVCFGVMALIIGSVYSGDEKKEVVEAQDEVVIEEERSVAEETREEIDQSKEDAAYRIEMRKRTKALEEDTDNPNANSYRRQAPASSAPSGLNEVEKKDYEQRSNYINSKRQLLEEALTRRVKKQAEGGFPVESDYVQNELDRFDAKYGKWN